MESEDRFAQGTAVRVCAADGVYDAQVMFQHVGDPARYMVAWLGDSPTGAHPVADWVDASQVALPHDTFGAGGTGLA